MTKERRNYPKEFKINAVDLLLKGGKTATVLAGDLGIHTELLYRWKRELTKNNDHAFPGSGIIGDPAKARLKEMEKRAKDAEEERDILKKALAIFSKGTR